MLKVTFCTYDKPDSVGGPFTWLQRLLPSLRAHGIEPRCLVMLHYGETGPTLESFRAEGISCEAVLCHPRTEDRVRWILECLRQHPPDIFVPNLPTSAYFAARWIRHSGIPTVGILHSDDPYYRGIQQEFVFGPKNYQVSALACVSRELEEQVAKHHPANTGVNRLPYGVAVPDHNVSRSPGTIRLAYVGRLAQEQKRILDVARALCRVVTELSATSAVIYGDGPDKAEVERILACERGSSAVQLGGVLPSGLVQKALFTCDVIVLLSDYEGLPIALMEAMACGCVPVCMRMRSGIPELVEDGVTGLLVDDRGDGFVAAIRRLQVEPLLWERLSLAAKAKIEAEFSDQVCDGKWASMLHKLAGSSTRRTSIKVPKWIRLPALNPALESPDDRLSTPTLLLKFWRKGRIFAGRIRRNLIRKTNLQL